MARDEAHSPEKHFIQVDGHWALEGTKATYLGPIRVNNSNVRIEGSSGLLLTGNHFVAGKLRVRATIHDEAAAARLVFGYDPETQTFYSMGINGWYRAYVLARHRNLDATLLEHVGLSNALTKGEKFIEVAVRGQRVSLAVDGVQVLARQLESPMAEGPVGVYVWGEGSSMVTFDDLVIIPESPSTRPTPQGESLARRKSTGPRTFETMQTKYTVVGVHCEGGSGRVYPVVDEDGAEHALKCLKSQSVSTEKIKRFRNELEFCKRPVHPSIVTVHDYGFDKEDGVKVPFYVMARYPTTLRTHMNSGIAGTKAVEVFRMMVEAVGALHREEVYHRDLKPENVLCDSDLTKIAVADLGIAHFADDYLATSVETGERTRLANFVYAAPEQRQPRRQGIVDRRADIYALGLMLNELFTGEVPQGTNFRLIGSVAPEFGFLDELVNQMLQNVPEDRISEAEEVLSAIFRGMPH